MHRAAGPEILHTFKLGAVADIITLVLQIVLLVALIDPSTFGTNMAVLDILARNYPLSQIWHIIRPFRFKKGMSDCILSNADNNKGSGSFIGGYCSSNYI